MLGASTLRSYHRSVRISTSTVSSIFCQHSRASSTSSDTTTDNDLHVKLFQYAICPFCNQTKAFLAYSRTPYEAIEVNPLTRQEIKWSKDYKKVPIAKIDEIPYFGSDKIVQGLLEQPPVVDRLKERWQGSNMDIQSFQNASSEKWVAFANNELAPLLYPNMCRTWSDAYKAFGYVDTIDKFSALQRFLIRGIGSFAMYMAASKVKQKRNIADERQALDEVLSMLETDGLPDGKIFLSGKDEPHVGDLAVYGTLRSIEGLPVQQVVVHDRGGLIPAWYERMTRKVKQE